MNTHLFHSRLPWLLLAAGVFLSRPCPSLADAPQVLKRTVVVMPDHKVIYERVRTPSAAAAQVTPPVVVPTAPPTTNTPRLPRKVLSLSCEVFNHEFTQIRWRDALGEYVIWSSLDLSTLTGRSAGGFDLGGVSYSLFMGLGLSLDEEAAEPLAAFRAIEKPAGSASWYVVLQQPSAVAESAALADAAFAGIDALHTFYDANETTILAEHQALKAENAARVAYALAHPPVKGDTVIQLWPIQSTLHAGENVIPSAPAVEEVAP